MSNRQYTEQELQQIIEAENILRTRGLIVDDKDGKELTDHNAGRIASYFDLNPHIPINVATILKGCDDMHDQLHWKSAAQIEYDNLYSVLSDQQKTAFGAWWYSPSTKKTIVIEGEEGFANAAKILQWMRGKNFDAKAFGLAVSNLASSRGLHWAPTPQRTDPRQHSGGLSFMNKSETNLSARDHAARRAADAGAAAGNKPATTTTDYKALAESITTARTHSDSMRLQKLFVMKRDNPTEIDWEQTAYQRQRLADGKAR